MADKRQLNLAHRTKKTKTVLTKTKIKLEIWGKAQRKSARRHKSDWERNFEG